MHNFLKKIIFLTCFVVLSSSRTLAQMVPDNTLGAESSTINSINELRDRIEGGAIRGENLFHSFEEFGIPERLEVYFANPEQISNIFSRVTGDNVSEIFGTLGVEGAANLFLINPKGIIFGENANIDVGGSFIATTGESIEFSGGESFTVRDENEEPILTWNAPIGINLGEEPGRIVVRGVGNNLGIPIPEFNIIRKNKPTGIEVNKGQTLGLLGGEIVVEGGNLTAPEGRIELGSVGGDETVNLRQLNSGWQFNYEEANNFQDISLLQEASVDTSGEAGGAIQLRGRQVNIEDGSAVVSNTLGGETGEGIYIKSDILEMSGASRDNFVNVIASDSIEGVGGNINIETSKSSLFDGSQIRAIVFGSGETGEVHISADEIKITGTNPLNFDYLTSVETSVATESIGGTGKDLIIKATNLSISDGGRILTDTFGIGNAGNIFINAQNIEIDDTGNKNRGLITGITTSTRRESLEGDAGDIIINSDRLRLTNGGRIRATSSGNGDSGDININVRNIDLLGFNPERMGAVSGLFSIIGANTTGRSGNINIVTDNLNVIDGARIEADNRGFGKSGNINIQANSIKLSGTRPARGAFVTGITASSRGNNNSNAGNIFVASENLTITNGASINAFADRSGDGGNVRIEATNLEIEGSDNFNLGIISGIYTNSRQGSGGNINIVADSIILDNEGRLLSFSSEGNPGGNINIESDRLSLNNGNISASANEEGGNISVNASDLNITDSTIDAESLTREGGNINIESDRVVAQDSFISASAGEDGNGGNVFIDADTVLGINSDITATAIRGRGGNITIDADGVLGFTEREASPDNETSDVDASSEFGTDGTVTITNPQTTDKDPLVAIQEPRRTEVEFTFRDRCETTEDGEPIVVNRGFSDIPETPDDMVEENSEYFPSTEIEPIPEVESSVPPISNRGLADDRLSREQPEPEPRSVEDLVWQPGDPYVQADRVVQTEDGRYFAVSQSQLDGLLERGCLEVKQVN